jgi:hypothetical protein
MWKLRRIVSHEYEGSQCYVMIEWENGEMTLVPLGVIAADDLFLAQYMPAKMDF